MNKTITKNLISIACLALFMFFAIGSEEDSEIELDVSSQSSEYTVTAPQLYSEYDSNEVAADLKYKDKVITVEGIIDDIGKDIMDDIYVTLKGDQYFGNVQCFFSDSHTDKAASLRKGDKITVKGLCTGKMMNVLVRGCIIR